MLLKQMLIFKQLKIKNNTLNMQAAAIDFCSMQANR